MKFNYIKYICFLFCLLLSACATKYTSDETAFYTNLKKDYEMYSQYKAQNFDWDGAKLFRDKAVKIKQGIAVEPEKVTFTDKAGDFISNDVTYTELSNAYERMNILLNNNMAKKKYPIKASDLQFYFDCWLVEEKYYTRYGQIGRCKQNFLENLNYLEFQLIQMNTEESDLIKKEIEEKKVEKTFIKPKKYVVYFDFDSSAINQAGSEEIWKFLNDVKNINGKYTVNIVGHADRIGNKKYNETISKRRANTVKHYLVKNGIPENIIKVEWSGNVDPMVITRNNFKEELNRRVDIRLKMLN